MTLRRSIDLRYAAIAAAFAVLFIGLIHHEFFVEPGLHCSSCPKPAGLARLAEFAEVFYYAMVPIVLGVGWWVMRRAFAPIDTLTNRIENIQVNNLRATLPLTGECQEVDRLAGVFNAMIERLDRSFRQVQDFTLHASHELKTPLTVMRAELETVLRDNPSLPAGWGDWIRDLLDEIQRLTKIVDALTLLAKPDSNHASLTLRMVRLGNLVRDSYEDALILAEPQRIRVTLPECADVTVLGDAHRLRQLLLNLTDNAIKYNMPGGTLCITLRQVDNRARLEVANTGQGVSPEIATTVFEQFVRGDNARRRGVEGSGLGLPIARWIVQAHGGTIEFSSVPGHETTVTVHLPIARA